MNISYDGIYHMMEIDSFRIPINSYEQLLIRQAICGILRTMVSKLLIYLNNLYLLIIHGIKGADSKGHSIFGVIAR
jgi:hypothetical protein